MIIEMPIANLSFLLLGGRKPSSNAQSTKKETAQLAQSSNNNNENEKEQTNDKKELKISINSSLKSSDLSSNEEDTLNTSLIERKPTAIN